MTRRGAARARAMFIAGAVVLVAARPADAEVTFTRDVAPILFRHCSACHQPDGPRPFSVLTYAEVRRRATQIAAVTEAGVMPPRKAEPGHGEFIGQARLPAENIATIRRWVAEGSNEGNPNDLPPLPAANNGWQLGIPDLIVRPPEYTLTSEGTDVFRIFVIPLPTEKRRYVRGLERVPRPPRRRRADLRGRVLGA